MDELAVLSPPVEESLDPESWDALRARGHALVDEMFEWLRTVRERPAWRPIPDEVRRALHTPLAPSGNAEASGVNGVHWFDPTMTLA